MTSLFRSSIPSDPSGKVRALLGRFLPAAVWLPLVLSCGAAGCSRPSLAARGESRPAARPAEIGWSDSEGDGIPDRVRLNSYNDRESFRRWFTSIAELQFYHESEAWKPEQRDCAGLVRFAWREALRPHDRAWFRKMGAVYEPVASDVRAYGLEHGPLGEKLFRTRGGAFKESDLVDGGFSDFADARTLKEFNCEFIGRDGKRAQPGDLLFFYQPWVQKFPYHVMIFLGKASQAAEGDDKGGSDWVVYHTGSTADDQGKVKKVRLATLSEHPDRRWRPVLTNENFLGFYRLKILK